MAQDVVPPPRKNVDGFEWHLLLVQLVDKIGWMSVMKLTSAGVEGASVASVEASGRGPASVAEASPPHPARAEAHARREHESARTRTAG